MTDRRLKSRFPQQPDSHPCVGKAIYEEFPLFQHAQQ